MKKTMIAVFLAAIAAGNVGAIELEGVNLNTLPPLSVEVPTPNAPEKVKTDGSWAREAARELRKDLREHGVNAKVSVANALDGTPALMVEFASKEEYEKISDLFYQDPGAPCYMDVKVVVMIDEQKTKSPLAGGAYRISCKYADAYEVNNVARLDLAGTYTVLNKDAATLAYEATLTYFEDQLPIMYFAVGEGLKNMPYSGVNYPNHFKFPLEWHGVGSSIEWANLIISKEPTSTVKDEYGATVRTFSGALDVSYNDHHGDYVKVSCTQREFEN